MSANRLSTTLVSLLGLIACGPEFGEDAVEFLESDPSLAPVSDDLEPLASDELPADEIEAPNNDHTVSCDLGLPANINADWYNVGVSSGVMAGIGSGYYTLEVEHVEPGPGLNWWELYVDGVYLGYRHDDGVFSPIYVDSGDELEFEIHAPQGAPPGYSYTLDVELYSYPEHQLICTDTTTMTIPHGCIGVGWWYTTPFPSPWFDGANCYVADLPAGAQGFMHANAWHVTPTNGNQCSIGTFDGANCYIGTAPLNREGFIWNQKLYYEN